MGPLQVSTISAAEDPPEFAAAICQLRRDDALRGELVRAGWDLARREHSTAALGEWLAQMPLGR